MIMESSKNNKKQWGITESVILCVILFAAGLLIEYFAGPVTFAFWVYPLNLIVGAVFVYAIVMVHWFGRKKSWGRWLSGVPMTLGVIAWMAYLAILTGLIPQSGAADISGVAGLLVRLGFTHIVSSWFFLLHAGLFLFVLGLVILKRLTTFSWRNVAFFLNHLGLWIAFAAGVLGSADRRELNMALPLGQEINTAVNKITDQHYSLPFTVTLDEFIMEEYPPKLAMVDNDGVYLPEGKPAFISVDEIEKAGDLLGWNIKVTSYLEEAASGKTKEFHPTTMRGGATAVRISATNADGMAQEGWVSAGNFMVEPVVLSLPVANRHIVMLEREPKRFASALTVEKSDGSVLKTIVEVNKPLSVEGYHLYQTSYDRPLGRWSHYSGLMVTYDPSYKIVFAGIYMMLAGALLMFLLGAKKKKI